VQRVRRLCGAFRGHPRRAWSQFAARRRGGVAHASRVLRRVAIAAARGSVRQRAART
jgi:hypothetical protein